MKNPTARAACACGLIAAVLVLLLLQATPPSRLLRAQQAAAADNNGVLDHFRCYRTSSGQPSSPAVVTLRDQFAKHENVQIFPSFAFCNPALKIHNGVITPIRNPNDHLTLHPAANIVPPPPQVIVSNQFGLQTLNVSGLLTFLFVPTQKLPHPSPRGLDHFLCYLALGVPLNVPVALKDQFGRPQETVIVLETKFLCNPVEKMHNQRLTRIQNPEDHLVFYDVTEQLFTTMVTAQNQFGTSLLTISETFGLAVPSAKCEPQGDLDNDGLIDARETLLGTILGVADSDRDGILDGNDDANGNGVDDEDEDDNDACPDRDSDGDGLDDEDEDD
jgi:hypothetical protein